MTVVGDSFVLRPDRVFDGSGSRSLVGHQVSVVGDRIAEVGPSGGAAGARTIDLPGATVLPGLIDCHVHYLFDPEVERGNSVEDAARRPTADLMMTGARNARVALGAGVTTARSGGAPHDLDIPLAAGIAAGDISGPRLLPAGRAITITGGHGSPFGVVADTIPEMVRAVRRLVAGGAEVIKVVASEAAMRTDGRAGVAEMDAEQISAIVTEAARLGRRVLVHAQDDASVEAAAQAGACSVEHAFLAGDHALRALAASGSALTPTLVVTDVYSSLPGLDSAQRARQAELSVAHRRSCQEAVRLGIPLLAGTDCGLRGVRADMIGREIELLVDHGLSPTDALAAATSRAAEALGVEHLVGTLAAGKMADLIVVDGDPLGDAGVLRRPLLVFQEGRLVVDRLGLNWNPGVFDNTPSSDHDTSDI
ncbi:MAG: amidohydrolase family protein [Acidimicrobiia bacterium]